jgi:hypothetical protein
VYVMCYRMLNEDGDVRAEAVLQWAGALLQAQAEGIGDPDLRRSFLERVAVNREIVEGRLRFRPLPARVVLPALRTPITRLARAWRRSRVRSAGRSLPGHVLAVGRPTPLTCSPRGTVASRQGATIGSGVPGVPDAADDASQPRAGAPIVSFSSRAQAKKNRTFLNLP